MAICCSSLAERRLNDWKMVMDVPSSREVISVGDEVHMEVLVWARPQFES